MIPAFRDYREERDWWRLWRDPPGLICCCVAGPSGPKTQIAYFGTWGTFATTYQTDAWTDVTTSPFSSSGPGFFTTASNPYAYSYTLNKPTRYNTGIGTWSTLAGVSTGTGQSPQCGTGVVSSIEHGYIIGGQGGTSPLAATSQYTVATDTFATKTAMPANKELGGGETMGGKIYCFQGGTGTSFPVTATNANYEYDPSGDSWATKTSAIKSYLSPLSAGLDTTGPIVSFGGDTPGPVFHNDVESYVLDTWTTRTSLTNATDEGMGCQYGLSTCHIFGGRIGSFTITAAHLQYVIDTFSSLASMLHSGDANGAAGSW